MRIISTNAVFTLAWAHELDPSINIDLTCKSRKLLHTAYKFDL